MLEAFTGAKFGLNLWPPKQHENIVALSKSFNEINLFCFFSVVNQKQAELDDLHLKLLYTQKYNEALHGDLKAKKNLNQETATQKKKAEEQKLQQVLARMKLDMYTATLGLI